MPRQSLTQTQNDTGGSAFFPSFQKEMNRLLDQFKSGFPMLDDETRASLTGRSFPALDIIETDDALEISAEIPGVKEDDLDATISGDTLILKGEKTADHEVDEDSYHLVERRYGSFRRHIPLGFAPEDGEVDAQFADGILKLRFARPATAKADIRKIDIKKT